MCGIAGQLNLERTAVSPSTLQNMTDAIAHRGPDGEGHWIDGDIGLGHRRLAILDLSQAAHQPMASHNNRYVITYNGEIYNFRELRAELESLGYQFRSHSDTEVALTAYIKWGTKAFTKFNGMYALAIWDKQERQLMLARDRYGIKPLYYELTSTSFIFASEQKAITAQPAYSHQLDKEALLEYFTFQNLFTNKTLEKTIKTFPAGNYGVIDLKKKNRHLELTQYWDYNFTNPTTRNDKQAYREELDRLFNQAVKRQLVSDVEVGSYLSGGIDSGSITAIAAQSNPYMKTFTCGFDLSSASGLELAFDERAEAEHMSYCFKTEHYNMVLKAGDMERCLPDLAFHLEEPRVGQSYPNYYAAKLASKFVKVVLGGTGGDELFGGYPWRYYRAVTNSNFNDYIDKYYVFWQRLVSNTELKQLFNPIWEDVSQVWTRDIFRDVFQQKREEISTPEDYINQSLYFEAKTFLHGLLTVEDKLSMAHGLENRVPFLDNDLVDFAMRCPVDLKLNNLADVVRINENEPSNKTAKYFQKTKDGKQILRDVMSQYIPESVSKATKQGFSAPDASWFKGDSIDFVKRKLMKDNSLIYSVFDKNTLQNLINQHNSGHQNRRLLIWSFLSFNQYLQHFQN